jgi:hypothetical protein
MFLTGYMEENLNTCHTPDLFCKNPPILSDPSTNSF